MADPTLPATFCNATCEFLGHDEAEELFNALTNSSSPTSIRFNPFKLGSRPEGDDVPWNRYGFYLSERPQFTLDPLFHGGAYYVQEASSMFVEQIYRATMEPDTKCRVLDLCASPGGKTTLLSTLVGVEGLVIANEVIRQRALTLCDNAKKWGLGNVVVTNNDPSHFAPFEHYFDMVVVDAPCSGEGMFRKSPEAREEWSESNVKLCAARSRRILSEIWDSLKPGGVMIFSTCTFNTTENEQTIEWLQSEYECTGVDINIDPSWGIVCGDIQGIPTFRFYPHRLRGEGFFAAALRKEDGRIKERTPKPRKTIFTDLTRKDCDVVGSWFNQSEYIHFAKVGDNIHGYYRDSFTATKQLSESLAVLYSGVLVGQLFGTKLRPEHPLALFHDLSRENFTVTDLDLLQALGYLRKGDIDPNILEEGINLLTYNDLPIGWIKRIGNRSNNMYPKELRIANI